MSAKKFAIGIDFGCHSSCVAVVRAGAVETIPNDMGNRSTASAVGFTATEPLVGDPAMNQFAKNSQNTVVNAKRVLGQAEFESDIVQEDIEAKYFSCDVVSGAGGKPAFEVLFAGAKKQFSAEDISATILKKMRETAEKYLGAECTSAVIGVPSYWKEEEEAALRKAASEAGLEVMRVVGESTCSVMGAGLDEESKSEKNVVVFDLGAGNLDLALLNISETGAIRVLSSKSDPMLGADKVTEKIVDYCRKDFKRKEKLIKDPLKDQVRSLHRLYAECEQAKRTLSSSNSSQIEVERIFEDKDYSGVLSRERLNEISEEYFNECVEMLEDLFVEEEEDEEDGEKEVFHGIEKSQITDVLIVGGGSKIIKIQELVKEAFAEAKNVKFFLGETCLQDEVVASGAAIQAGLLLEDRMNDERRIMKLAAENLEGGKDVDMSNLVINTARILELPTLSENISLKNEQGSFETLFNKGQAAGCFKRFTVCSKDMEFCVVELAEGAKNKALLKATVPTPNASTEVEIRVSPEGNLVVRADGEQVALASRK